MDWEHAKKEAWILAHNDPAVREVIAKLAERADAELVREQDAEKGTEIILSFRLARDLVIDTQYVKYMADLLHISEKEVQRIREERYELENDNYEV